MKNRWIIAIIGVLSSTSLYATEVGSGMVNGAGTLGKGRFALSLDGGLNLPEPLIYGLKIDYGVLDHWQTGLKGTAIYAGSAVRSTIGSSNTLNIWEASGKNKFFSLLGAVSYLRDFPFIGDVLQLEPGLAYEYRFGREKNIGVYIKFCTSHLLLLSDSEFFSSTIKKGEWRHLILPGGGFQRQWGEHFAFTFELFAAYSVYNQKTIPLGKVGFTWAF